MADTKISALTAAGSFLGADEFPVNEAGTTKKVTGNQLLAWLKTTSGSGQFSPANPTGTTSTTGLMMGLGTTCSVTAAFSTKFLIFVSGTIFNATAIADGGKVQIRWGTGTAPANAAALIGTTAGGLVQFITATTAAKSPFALQALATFSTYVPVWIDVGLAAIVGGTANITDISVTAFEI